MKLFKNATLTLAVIMLLTTAALAQDRKRENSETWGDKRAEKMKTELALSDAQAEEFKKLDVERAEKYKSMRAEMKAERSKRWEEMKAVNEAYNAQVLALLNEEQKDKYETLKAERKLKMKDKMKDGKKKRNYHRKGGKKGDS